MPHKKQINLDSIKILYVANKINKVYRTYLDLYLRDKYHH